jgi:hypothetical protein
MRTWTGSPSCMRCGWSGASCRCSRPSPLGPGSPCMLDRSAIEGAGRDPGGARGEPPWAAGAARGPTQDERLQAAAPHPAADRPDCLHRRHQDRKVNGIGASARSSSGVGSTRSTQTASGGRPAPGCAASGRSAPASMAKLRSTPPPARVSRVEAQECTGGTRLASGTGCRSRDGGTMRPQRLRTNTSELRLVSPGTRLLASEENATCRPSAESAGSLLISLP